MNGEKCTIEELAAVGLAGCDFESHDVALRTLIWVSKGQTGRRGRSGSGMRCTCASLRSLIGMPIVEVMVAMGGFVEGSGELCWCGIARLVVRWSRGKLGA